MRGERSREAWWFVGRCVALLLPVLLAVVYYFLFLSPYLPLGDDLRMAADCIFGLDGHGRGIAPFVWGGLVRLSWHVVPGAPALRLGVVSAVSGVVAVALFTYCINWLLTYAVRFAEANAQFLDEKYGWVSVLGTMLCGFAFVLSPGFFMAATRTGALMTSLAMAVLPFALAVFASGVVRLLTRVYVIVLIGLTAALAAWEGTAGAVSFPIVFFLVWNSTVRGDLRIASSCGLFAIGAVAGSLLVIGDSLVFPLPKIALFDGLFPFLAAAIVPTLVLYGLIHAKKLRGMGWRQLFFGVWTIGVLALSIGVFHSHPLEYGRAADAFTRGILDTLGERKFIVSDGRFDDLILFAKPDDVFLVSFRHEHDPAYGRWLADLVKRELAGDGNLVFAAELGPRKFVSEWMTRPGAAGKCVFSTLAEPVELYSTSRLKPAFYTWVSMDGPLRTDATALNAEWQTAWDAIRPSLSIPNEPGGDLIRRTFSVQGNAVATLLQGEGKPADAWKLYAFIVESVCADNLSTLINLGEMIREGYVADKWGLQAKKYKGLLRSAIEDLRNEEMYKYRLAVGGRVYVSPKTKESLNQLKSRLRRDVWKTPFGLVCREALDRLAKLDSNSGSGLEDGLREIESSVLPFLKTSDGPSWIKHLYLGEYSRLRGPGWRVTARDHFRLAVKEGEGASRVAQSRLLRMDMEIGDPDEIEYDALLVLRQDIHNAVAHALVGSVRLGRGENESAERFLRRAVDLGFRDSAVLSDFALALSRLGRQEEAEEIRRSGGPK